MIRLYALALYAVLLTSFIAASIKSTLEERREYSNLRDKATALAAGIQDSVLENFAQKKLSRIQVTVNRLKTNHGILGMALCVTEAAPDYRVSAMSFPKQENWDEFCTKAFMLASPGRQAAPLDWTTTRNARKVQVNAFSIQDADGKQPAVTLLLVQDLSYLRKLWTESFLHTLVLTLLGGLSLLLLISGMVRSWFKGHLKLFHQRLYALLSGRKLALPDLRGAKLPPELQPISRDIDRLTAKILTMPHRHKTPEDPSWMQNLRSMMVGRKLVVIANREPYIHERKSGKITVVRPASGLVTALEPILRQSGGLWVAHGGGSADRDTADANSEVAVPPSHPSYTLRRVWLTPEQEQGYYYGFANEGLWPLCHLAHNRPVFRLSDWEHYSSVNQVFCDSTPAALLDDKALILVQDYHFALLPRMLKIRAQQQNPPTEQNPQPGFGPKISLFWHIPWPNPEAFGICPWNKELLRGMLGADVLGFHTQYHCNNFLETCDRYLEARIDWERFSVSMENHETLIRAFPIGIDTPPVPKLSDEERIALREKYGIRSEFVAVGVDRLDYTKGLIERIESVERFLEKNPQYIGRFTLAQMGSPSRTHIPAYQALHEKLNELVKRVNERFGDPQPDGYQPICLLASHHDWDEIQYFYQIGDICMVTSLHDGMNLVAKEYIWCQRPDRGSLILSKFAGASRELTEAFLVNPYSIEEMADAIAAAIALTPEQRAARMNKMREKVENHNAFHWASEIIQSLITEVGTPDHLRTTPVTEPSPVLPPAASGGA